MGEPEEGPMGTRRFQPRDEQPLNAEEAIESILDALDVAVIGLSRTGEITWRRRFLRLRSVLAEEAGLRRARRL